MKQITFTHEQAEAASEVLADILCFFKGVEFATAIQPNKKVDAALSFINREKVRQLKATFDSHRLSLSERNRILEATPAGEVIELRKEIALLRQQIRLKNKNS